MYDLLSLKPMQLDALREVANIGAGHAATALSQMTGQTIMIAVPTINITPLEEVPPAVAAPPVLIGATYSVPVTPTVIAIAAILLFAGGSASCHRPSRYGDAFPCVPISKYSADWPDSVRVKSARPWRRHWTGQDSRSGRRTQWQPCPVACSGA